MKKNIKSIFLLTLLVLLLVGITSVNATDDLSVNNTGDTTTQIDTTPSSEVQDNVISEYNYKEIKKTNTPSVKTDTEDINYYVSDTNGQDTNTGSVDSPFKTIQTALDKTAADKTYNIYIAEGTYKGLKNTNLTVNGNHQINIIGSGINKTVIDGQANYTYHVTKEGDYYWESSKFWEPYDNGTGNWIMNITPGNGNIKIINMTIQNSWATGINGADSIDKYPWATIDNYGNLEVDTTYFLNNHGGVGSAIRNNNQAKLLVNNSFFEGNRKSKSTGNDGIIYNNGTTTIYNSLFNHNYARWGTILNDQNLTIINSTLKDNIAYDGVSAYKFGSGIAVDSGNADFYIQYDNENITTVIQNCKFTNNEQCDIYQGKNGYLTVDECEFDKSTGIYFAYTDTQTQHNYTITKSTFNDMINSSLLAVLSNDNGKSFSIYNNQNFNTLIIENNQFLTENAYILIESQNTQIKENNINTNINITGSNNTITFNNITQQVNIAGSDNTITKNNINTTSPYTIKITKKGNTVTENTLQSYSLFGDETVSSSANNIIENNLPTNDNIILTNENYNNYFSNGIFNESKLTGDTLYIRGEIKNKQLIFNFNTQKTINIIGYEDNILENSSITINQNTKANIEKLNINNSNSRNKYQIQLNSPENTIKNTTLTSNNPNIYSISITSNDNTITENTLTTINAIKIENSESNIITNNQINAENSTIQLIKATNTVIEENYLNQNNTLGGDFTIKESETTGTTTRDNTPKLFTLTDENYNQYFEDGILKINEDGLTIQLGTDLYNKNMTFNNKVTFQGKNHTIYNGSITANAKTNINNTQFNSTDNNIETIIDGKARNANIYNSTIYHETTNNIKTVNNSTIRYTKITVTVKNSNTNTPKIILDDCDTSYSDIQVTSTNDDSMYEVTKFGRIEYSTINIMANNITATNNSRVYYDNITVIGKNYANAVLRATNSLIREYNQFQVFSYNNITVESDNIAIGLIFGEMPEATQGGDISHYNNFTVISNNTGSIFEINNINMGMNYGQLTLVQNDLKGTNVDGIIIKDVYTPQSGLFFNSLKLQLNSTTNQKNTGIKILNSTRITFNNYNITSQSSSPVILANNSTRITLSKTASNYEDYAHITTEAEGYVILINNSETVEIKGNYIKSKTLQANNAIESINSNGLTYSNNIPATILTEENYDQIFINQELNESLVLDIGSDLFNKTFIFNKEVTLNNPNNYTIYNSTIKTNALLTTNNLIINNTNYEYNSIIANGGIYLENAKIYQSGNNTESIIMNSGRIRYSTIIYEGNNITLITFDGNNAMTSNTFQYNNITITGDNVTALYQTNTRISTSRIMYNNISIKTDTPTTAVTINNSRANFNENNILINTKNYDTPVIKVITTTNGQVNNNYIETLDITGDDAVDTPGTKSGNTPNGNTNFKSTLSIDIEKAQPNSQITIPVIVTDAFGNEIEGIITATINDEEVPILNNEIKYTTTIDNLTITATYTDPNGKYNTATETKTVPIEKVNTNIDITAPEENTVNKTTPITIIFTDENNNLIKNSQIIMSTSDKTETLNLKDGVLIYKYIPTTVGEETITFSFEGNNGYESTTKKITLTVTQDKDQIIEELNNTIQEQNSTIENLTNTVEEQASTISSLNDTVNDLNTTVQEQSTTIENLNNTVQEQNSTIENLTNTVEEQASTISSLNDTVNDLNSTVQQQADTINTLNDTVQEQTGTIESLNNTVQEQASTINSLNETVNDLNSTVQEQTDTINDLNNTVQEQSGTIENLNNTVQEQAGTINSLNDTVNDLNSTVQQQASTISDLNNTIQTQNSTIEDLQEQIDELKAPKNTTITFDEITDARYNGNVTISGSLVNDESIGLFNQVVTLTIGDEEVNVTTKGGVFEYTTVFKELGEKTVTAKYAGSDKYLASNATTTFNVEKQDVIVTVDEINDIAYGENVTITGKFTQANGKAISNSNVNIYINGKQYKARTDKTGAYTVSVEVKTVGINNVTAGYSGNAYYNSYETSTTFNTEKQDLLITVDEISDVKYGDNVTITGKFTDKNGKAISNSNVNIYINGKQYKARTDKTGAFTLTAQVKAIGTNNVTVSYGGNDKFNSFETSTTFNADKQDLLITVNPIQDTKCGDNVTITGKFTDKNGKAISNSNVNVYINGKQYKARTDSTGAFKLEAPTSVAGINNVTLSYGGNAYYNSYETTTTFNVIAKNE